MEKEIKQPHFEQKGEVEKAKELVINFGDDEMRGEEAEKFMDYWHGKGKWHIDSAENKIWLSETSYVDSDEMGNKINGEEVTYRLE